jgi:HEPN domain-containing protein
MKKSTKEWADLAEGDYISASATFATGKRSAYNSVCYLCHQAAEKYIKARLNEAGIPIPRTHSLELLLDMTLSYQPLWESMRAVLRTLNSFAADVRYPGSGVKADRAMAKAALDIATMVRQEVRKSLALSEEE